MRSSGSITSAEAVRGAGESGIDGVLFDLGVSSHMLDDPRRGFTFRELNAPLDMRMAREQGGETAADLLNGLDAAELTRIFRDYADEIGRLVSRSSLWSDARTNRTQ